MTWPARFREAEANYAQFYTQPPLALSVTRLYASEKGELESIGRSRIELLKPGEVSAPELAKVVANGSKVAGVHYNVEAGGVFTVAVGPENMETFVSTDWEPRAWTPIAPDTSATIRLPDTVHALSKETTLILLYRRAASRMRHKTAKRGPLHVKAPLGRKTRRARKGLKDVVLKHNT